MVSKFQHIDDGKIVIGTKEHPFEIAYQEWIPIDGVKNHILCYPGWLDNSGSFEPLAPYLAMAGFHVIAIDPPGCGWSAHRSLSAWYNDFEEIHVIVDIANKLNLDRFYALGHSRGSNIIINFCGVFPERVIGCVLVESNLGMAGTYMTARKEFGPNRFSSFPYNFKMNEKSKGRSPRVFKDLEEAILHNLNNPTFPKSRQIAEAIVRRHVIPVEGEEDGQFTFAHDVRTYGQAQAVNSDEEATISTLKQVKCPVLGIYGANTSLTAMLPSEDRTFEERVQLYKERFVKVRPELTAIPESALIGHVEDIENRVRSIRDLELVVLPGDHHLHGDIPEQVGASIIQFLDRIENEGNTRVPPPLPDVRKVDQLSVTINHLLAPFMSGQDAPDTLAAQKIIDELPPGKKDYVVHIDGIGIGVSEWGDKATATHRILALCDKLDNSGSFDALGKQVAMNPKYCLLAIDGPGRGRSTKMPNDYRFGLAEEAALLFHIADHFNWEEFQIWGHGTGGGVALMASGIFPNRVQNIVVMDLPPTTIPDEWIPHEMSHSYKDKTTPKELPKFPTFEALVTRLETDPVFPKSRETAINIAKRRAVFQDNMWHLSDDPRVFSFRKPVLEVPFSRFSEILSQITAPILVLLPALSQRRSLLQRNEQHMLLMELGSIRSPLTILHVDDAHSHVHSCNATQIFQLIENARIQNEQLTQLIGDAKSTNLASKL